MPDTLISNRFIICTSGINQYLIPWRWDGAFLLQAGRFSLHPTANHGKVTKLHSTPVAQEIMNAESVNIHY